MKHARKVLTGVALAVTAGATLFISGIGTGAARAATPDEVKKGEYLVRAAGCIACHTVAKGGKMFAGGRALETPFGTFYSPNITADQETGIGAWTDDQFVDALHKGERPAGGRYFPVFPYTSYTRMTREDALLIKAYLFSLPPVNQANREHDVSFPFSWRFLQRGWRMLNFDEGRYEPDSQKSAEWNRGAYLVQALAHCGECHTPRNIMGGLKDSAFLSGTTEGPDNELVPNITPHATGIADWADGDLTTLLRDGTKPDFDDVQGSMAEAIDDGLKYLTDADLAAIEAYLKSVPAIDNKVERSN